MADMTAKPATTNKYAMMKSHETNSSAEDFDVNV
jgi:hypothetical protein